MHKCSKGLRQAVGSSTNTTMCYVWSLSRLFCLLAAWCLQVYGWSIKCTWNKPTDLDCRSPTSCTAPCNGVISHGAPMGGIWVFADHTHTWKQTQTKCVHDLCVPCGISHVFIFSLKPQLMQMTYAPDESVILITRKPKYPSGSHMLGRKGADFLISGLNLWTNQCSF